MDNALYNLGKDDAGCDYDFISWPASGNFPANKQLFAGDFAWSVTPNPRKYTVSPGSVTVTLKRESDGQTWTFGSGERYTASDSGKYFNVNTDPWALEKGVTAGTSATTFSPYSACTRGQVVTFLWRAKGKPAAGGDSALAGAFPKDFYTNAVAWADTGAAFNPGSQSPRANIVTYLYRDLAE